MTAAERVLAHFDRISEAPDAVPHLRRFIVDLAVRGKLVTQDPKDGSPEDCLAAARAALAKSAEQTTRLRWTPSDAIAPDEAPHNIPPGWVPARVNDTGLYINGLAFKPSDWKQTGFPIIRIQNLTDQSKEFNYANGEFPDEVIVRNGDILVSWSATLEAFEWKRGQGVLNQHIFRVLPAEKLTRKRFLYLLLRHAIRAMADSRHADGLVMTHINRGPFLAHVVLIPPLAEQHRIVAKVDELMALCDRLQAAQRERESRRDRLVSASLARLNQLADPPSFREHARFLLRHLPGMTANRGHVQQLRQTILDLAVHGKLVEQHSDDEPASEWLSRISRERAALVERGLIRREKPVESIDLAEQPFDLATGWLWSRIGDVVLFTQYGTSDKSSLADRGVPVLAMGNIRGGAVVWSDEKKIPETSDDLPALLLDKFDILYNRTNSAELVGKTGIYLGEGGVRTFASYLIRLRPSLAWSNPRYLNMAMNTPRFRATQIVPLIKKQTGQANVNGSALRKMLIPLPPLPEQHRIVAKVDELMAVCDLLEAQL